MDPSAGAGGYYGEDVSGGHQPPAGFGPPAGYGPPPGMGMMNPYMNNAGPATGGSQFPPDPEMAYMAQEVRNELGGLDPNQFKHAARLLQLEYERLEQNGEGEYLEVDVPKPVKVVRKVLIPIYRHPRFNFVGKLLGPGGKTLQALAKDHKCHVFILGKGSTKDKAKEDEQLATGDPKYAHLALPLHVRIETEAPVHVAFKRISGVMETLHNYLQPVRDAIVEGQMAEMGHPEGEGDSPSESPGGVSNSRGRGAPRAVSRGRGGGMRGRGMTRGRGGAGGMPPQFVTYPGYDYGGYTAASADVSGNSAAAGYDGGGKAAASRGRGAFARPSPY